MATSKPLAPFDAMQGDWDIYCEQAEQHFIAYNVNEEKKVALLLSSLPQSVYKSLRALTSPDLPSAKAYNEIKAILSGYLKPKRSVFVQRYDFHRRNQNSGESVASYATELKQIAEGCAFGNLRDEFIRDRLIFGLKDEATKKKLLSKQEAKLTLSKAQEIATALESAAKEIASNAAEESCVVNTVYHKQACIHCARTNHKSNECKLRYAVCYRCGKQGHIASICSSREKPRTANSVGKSRKWQPQNANMVKEDSSEDENELDLECLETYTMKSKSSDIIWVTVNINGVDIKMEVDTGSALSIIPTQVYKSHFIHEKLLKTGIKLKTYTGERLFPDGVMNVEVNCSNQICKAKLYVVETPGPPLFGRDWLHLIKLDWKTLLQPIHNVSTYDNLQNSVVADEINKMTKNFKSIFEDGIGKLIGPKAKLVLRADAKPKFLPSRPVPYALKPAVEAELKRLEENGILYKVKTSEWSTPIVPVLKKDGTVRICGDFKTTVNPVLHVDHYPLPRIDDIFASLAGGQHFTKIDLRQAYLHMEVEENSKHYLTINTHKGLFRYNRLIFGIASAPAIWQRTMEQVLEGIPGTRCILDDMIVTGRTTEEHLHNLRLVLQRLSECGLRVNRKKTVFFKDNVEFCGFKIDKNGLHKTQSKITAILNATRPSNVSQVRSFIGLVNYYQRFIRNLSTILHPLNKLLQKGYKWQWSKDCEQAFCKVKELITSDTVLTHYDPKLPIRLACDASPYGLGAVLSHVFEDGIERPIAFASKALTTAQKNYSQIEKEALAIIWSIKKFHCYLFARHFTLVTDHRPLTSIFHPHKSIPTTTAARLQRYALFLCGHTYDIEFRNSTKHANADALSRLPVTLNEKDAFDDTSLLHIAQLDTFPVTCKEIRKQTLKDPTLSTVLDLVLKGWVCNDECDPVMKTFYSRRDELTSCSGCVMWGARVVIPNKLRKEVLDELHKGHLGMVKMKTLARSYFWWPGLNADIENLVKQCAGCRQVSNLPGKAPCHWWEHPAGPWQRIHIDFAGPFYNSMFLIVVDAYSKWPEVIQMNSTTSEQTIVQLRRLFSQHGIPHQLVSDNGPQFTSDEFRTFMCNNGIKHITSAPFHPATNGLAERFVQTFKQAIRAMRKEKGTIAQKLCGFLLRYRNALKQYQK